MFKSCLTLCLIAAILSGCNVTYDYYQPPGKKAEQAGVKKLAIGNAHTLARSVPTTGTVRISHIDGKQLYFEEKDFEALIKNEILDRHEFIGVSPGLTEFQIEFIFKSEDGGGYFCKGSQLVEIEAGKRYEPVVSFDENAGVFKSWIKEATSGEVASQVSQGEWTELDQSDFVAVVGDWVRRSPVIGYTDIYGPNEEDRLMLSAETTANSHPPEPNYDSGDGGSGSSGGSK